MRITKTQQDIYDLRQDCNMLKALVEHIVQFFCQLEAELVNKEEHAFHLDQHGPIILLEAGDNLHSLNIVGLGNHDLRRVIEFVETLDLGDIQAYRLAAKLDNEFLVTVFIVAGTHNEEEEEWLKEQTERN